MYTFLSSEKYASLAKRTDVRLKFGFEKSRTLNYVALISWWNCNSRPDVVVSGEYAQRIRSWR